MKFSPASLVALAAVTLLSMPVLAADTPTTGASSDLPNLSSATSETTANSKTTSTTGSGTGSATGSATGSGTTTTTGDTQTGTSLQSSTIQITGSGTTGSSGTGAIPTITGGSSATSGGALPTGLPTLSGAFVIVAPSVPPTANAPFMKSSNMPEGTVFIVVGAILGFLAMSVMLWRGLVAWSLHRSVKRAAAAQYTSDTKALFRTPPAPLYKFSDRDSTISLGPLAGKGGRKGSTAPSNPRASTLFFSPTAGAAGAGMNNPGNRGSNYLPAGYYAAGASAPGNGQGMTHIGHGPSISMSNLGPARDGYARARSMGTTPPDSPMVRPQSQGVGHTHAASSSTLNLNTHGEVPRAPSAYLEDLFDGDNGLPVPGHGQNYSPNRF